VGEIILRHVGRDLSPQPNGDLGFPIGAPRRSLSIVSRPKNTIANRPGVFTRTVCSIIKNLHITEQYNQGVGGRGTSEVQDGGWGRRQLVVRSAYRGRRSPYSKRPLHMCHGTIKQLLSSFSKVAYRFATRHASPEVYGNASRSHANMPDRNQNFPFRCP